MSSVRSSSTACASAVATFTAIVVVPTPPLAPMKANTWPWIDTGRVELTRSMAAVSSGTFSGSASHSLTPARMASSINDGSIRAATITTPVVGCCRFSVASVGGNVLLSRTSSTTTSGWLAEGCASASRSATATDRMRVVWLRSSSSSWRSALPTRVMFIEVPYRTSLTISTNDEGFCTLPTPEA